MARAKGQPFDILLTRYVLERLLYRLSLSVYRNQFVLKGALLITTLFVDPHRPTRDLDLLGFGDSSPAAVLAIFREVCGTHADDGVTFDVKKLRIDLIREA